MSEDREPCPTRRLAKGFAWCNMFVHPDDDPRSGGGFAAERTMYAEYLRDQRLTRELKCSGLDADHADFLRERIDGRVGQ